MVATKINAFGGMIPAADDRLLPDQNAALAQNTWLYSGAIAGINQPKTLRTLPANTSKVYRIPNNFVDSLHLADSIWLDFQDIFTDVLKSAVVGDTFERYYFASPTTQPKYNTRDRINNGDPSWLLGIPTPTVAPTVSPSGGVSGTNRTTAYVYTWVSAYGEEGPPSPPTVTTGKVDDTWSITLHAADPNDLGVNRNLEKVRIYRTVTDANGIATYFFVVEQAITLLTYNDTFTDATVAENSVLESTLWAAPPVDLEGWVSMPNGMVAGFRDNEIWFCEPYRPHAWPASYALAVDFPIVGLGVVGQTLVVCTENYPVAVNGIHPATMSQAKLANLEPCMSRGSVISSPEGVYYVSPNGLILVANGVATNITANLITKDRWQAIVGVTALATLNAAKLGNAYYAFGTVRQGVFDEDAFEVNETPFTFQAGDFAGGLVGILIDPSNERIGFVQLTSSIPATNIQNDPWTGEVFAIRENVLYWIDTADTTSAYEVFKWRSKVFQASMKKNFAAIRVYFTLSGDPPTLNPTRNTDLVQTLAADQYALLRIYADDDLVATRELRTSGELMRLPSGFKADYWQFEIEGRIKILSFQVGTSVKELAAV